MVPQCHVHSLIAHPLSFVAAVAVPRPLGMHYHVPCLRLGGVGVILTRTVAPAYWHINKTCSAACGEQNSPSGLDPTAVLCLLFANESIFRNECVILLSVGRGGAFQMPIKYDF